MLNFETATKEYLTENPDLSGVDSYEQTLDILEEKSKEDLVARLKKLDEELPIEERIKRLEQSKEEVKKNDKYLNKPIRLTDIKPEDVKLDWIWETFIAKGHTTLLSASPKDGKSTFIRCFLKSLTKGEEFCGEPITKSNVLVISEESKTEWYEEGGNFELLDESLNLWIWARPYSGNLSKKEWVDFVIDVLAFCKENNIDMVILDTLTAFWPVLNENDNSEASQALKAFYALTENNIAVFLIHHDSKHGGLNGKSIRGASSILQFPDQALMFSRLEGTNENSSQRVLKFRGRLKDDDAPIVINYDVNKFQYSLNPGSIHEVSKDYKIKVILTILEKSEIPLSTDNISELWDETFQGKRPNIRSFRRYISTLTYAQQIRVVEERVIVKKLTPFYGLINKEYVNGQSLLHSESSVSAVDVSNEISKDSEIEVDRSNEEIDKNVLNNNGQITKDRHESGKGKEPPF